MHREVSVLLKLQTIFLSIEFLLGGLLYLQTEAQQ
jgi:hypothetical protein